MRGPRSARRARLAAAVAVVAGGAVGAPGCGGSGDAGDANVVSVRANDPAIAAAQAEAQRRWPEFVASFRKGDPALRNAVKVAFPTAGGSAEHMWVQVTAIRGDSVSGTLANEPVGDVGYAFGDRVAVEKRRVEDWLVTRGDDVVLGGFSLEAVEDASE